MTGYLLRRVAMLAVLGGGMWAVVTVPPAPPDPPFNLPRPRAADDYLCWGLLGMLAVVPVLGRAGRGDWPAVPPASSPLIAYGAMLGLWIALCWTVFRAMTAVGAPLPSGIEWVAL